MPIRSPLTRVPLAWLCARGTRYTKPPEMSQQEWDRAQKAAPEAYGSSDAGAGSDFRDDGLAG